MPASRAATLVAWPAVCEGEPRPPPGADQRRDQSGPARDPGSRPVDRRLRRDARFGDPDAFLPSDLVIRQVLGDAGGPLVREWPSSSPSAGGPGVRTPWRILVICAGRPARTGASS